ncbi:bifunctional diguanylate cyclase/phosphodiesterase [Cellulomonas sp. P24]|uniref:putative bifunctional diguanylate cyclase/phosphodiesterase n=1 Tax=Cellulomonas sp. P24 TaxID=2885206 RepID=UPI00216AC5D6|nr:bifunctional diguanylate cyclase/phosphodiesterase [Cellulomonas sp. P24]MCR6492677.1 bifunctional diguanylate cyclase/phosphodiesterase [Cellulomonas sp. P24]
MTVSLGHLRGGTLPSEARTRLRELLRGWVVVLTLMVATDILVVSTNQAPQAYLAAFLVIAGIGVVARWSTFAVLVGYVVIRFAAVGDRSYTAWLLAACGVAFASWRYSAHVSERQRRRHAELEHLATHDELTGLPVRSRLRSVATELVPEVTTSLTLAIVDLDRFVEISRTLGRELGDDLIVEIATRIVRAVRPQDVVGRLGPSQFGVLLPDATLPFARSIVEAVRRQVTTTMNLGGVDVGVEATVGIAQWSTPTSGSPAAEPDRVVADLLRQAEIAVHEAKNQLAPAAVYDVAVEAHSADRLELLAELREAIDTRSLSVRYQPVLDLDTSHVRCVEALVHWQHPTRGLLTPREFVPLAEATALSGPLTTLVLDLTLAQSAVLASTGRPVEMSVNISPRTLLATGFAAQVLEALDRHEVSPAMLRLEITEAGLHADPFGARAVLQRLTDHGIKVSIDDFGAGYSSLTHLRDLPVDELKIDRGFVTGLATTAADSTGGDPMVVRAAALLGHTLGMTVVAKGAETSATVETVKLLGCDCVQGYFLARPMDPERLLHYLGPQTARFFSPGGRSSR